MIAVFVVPVEWLREYGNIAALLAALAGTYFVLGSLRYSRWRESSEGVHLVVFSSVLTGAMWWIFISRFAFTPNDVPPTGERLVQLMFGVSVYVSLFFLMLWRAVIFTRVQLQDRRKLRKHAAQR
jgi:cation transporter-like permease